MLCRSHCGACCIAPSISSPIPGMPYGKTAGETCVQLLEDMSCAIFESRSRPKVCAEFMAEKAICGDTREDAIRILNLLEHNTK